MSEDQATIEHLIPLSKGGSDRLHNLVLCLGLYNRQVGDLNLVQKIKYREHLVYGASFDTSILNISHIEVIKENNNKKEDQYEEDTLCFNS